MAGEILRKVGVILLNILKGILQVLLFIFKAALTAVKMVILLFVIILRVFLSFLGAK